MPSMNIITRMCIAGFILVPLPSLAENQKMTVTDPRPVYQVVRRLEHNHRAKISYEDPELEFVGDLRDVEEENGRKRPSGRPPSYLPIDYSVSVDLPDSRELTREDLEGMIADVSHQANLGYSFKVEEYAPQSFHVIPVSIRNKKGVRAAFVAPLSTRVSLPKKRRTLADLLYSLKPLIDATGHLPMMFGELPIRKLTAATTEKGFEKVEARQIIQEVVTLLGPEMSWYSWCSPQRGCLLEIGAPPLQPVGR